MDAKPFRWNIAKREQLGRILSATRAPDLDGHPFLDAIRDAAARILALSGASDLAFIGRTPENFYDYLSGLFHGIDAAPQLHLIQFSLRWLDMSGPHAIAPARLDAFLDYLTEEGVTPAAIASGRRSLCLVDFVAHGGTMRSFVHLLHRQAERDGTDWNAVQRKLRIIGLRTRTKNSPNTWRWQQHQDWLDLIPDTDIKNVSAPAALTFFIANEQPKTTESFHPGRWPDPRDGHGTTSAAPLDDDRLAALALAAALYDIATTRDERHRLAARIAQEPQMRDPTVRALVQKLKGL